jgi:hypothetical protein
MSDTVIELGGVPVLACGAEGALVSSTQDALDLIGSAFSRADVVAVPAGRLDERFFDLRSGLAGEVMQKFVNYRLRLVVVGGLDGRAAPGTALGDLVAESNRGSHVWFVADLDELGNRLSPVA